jgi:signal transduction histidine kinase
MTKIDEKRFSVLLADDVPELRKLLRQVLELTQRFDVVGEAENGLQAIELAGSHFPDLVLLDISMPVMDGMEALPRIIQVSPATKVVILSGFEADRLAASAVELGAAAYIEKGIPPALLVSQLLDVVSRNGGAPPRSIPAQPLPADASKLLDVSPEEMMSLVAHEIRNPLAVIQGFGTELQNRWDTMADDLRKDAVKRMTERARYLNTVVNNLMYMRKLEAGHAWVAPGPTHVREMMQALGDELVDLARGHALQVHIEDDLPQVRVDALRLRQVLTNLVVNAAKFSPADAPISLRATRHPNGVVVEVADQGPGIPPDMRMIVFDKFCRLERGGAGIGLGLFISKALMTSMQGEIWVRDSEGGTTVACLIPAA